jgi:PKD domain
MLARLRIPIAVAISVVSSFVGAGVASAAAWQAPVALNISATSAAKQPSVGIDGVGNTIATWQTDPAVGNNVIQGTRHLFGGFGFTQLPDVANDPGFNDIDAITVVNRAGQGFVAWVHDLNSMGNQQVEMSTVSPGGIISGIVTPISTPSGNYTHLTGAIDAAGDAVIAWTHNSNATEVITRQGLAGAFTAQQSLDSAATGGPSVAIDSGGNALAIWPTNALAGALRYSHHPAGGSWALNQDVFTGGHTYTEQALSGDPTGQVVVAYQDAFVGGPDVGAASGTITGGFGTPQVLSAAPISNLHGPGVNVDDVGTAVVGWTTATAVQYSSRPNGASFPPPGGVQSITPVPVGPANFELAGNGRGDVIAAWYGFETGPMHNVARAAVKPAGASAFGASQIISDTHQDTYDEVMALDQNGDAVVGLPLGSSGGPLGVEAAAYDASPPVLGNLSGPTRIARGARGSFSTSATDAFSPFSFSWSFGDGSAAAAGASVSHTFTRAGTFTVRVTATDTAGNSSAKQITVTVTSPPPPPNCRVPKLKGKTLSQAKTLLRRAHCRLGRVHKPRKPKHRKLRKLIVASSSPRAGRVRPNGTKVSLTLKEAPKPKPRHKH